MGITARGGTLFEPALEAAEQMLQSIKSTDGNKKGNMNKVFFLTDMKLTGDQHCDVVGTAHALAAKEIYITFVGIGIDFGTDMAYKLAKVKGCSNFSVASPEQFRKQMMEDFDYTTMLICYAISLKLQSDEFDVEYIYGSPAVPDKSIGEVLRLDAICPSPKSDEGGIKGGVVVLKLRKKNPENTEGGHLALQLSYTDWDENKHNQETMLPFPGDPTDSDYYQNSTIRKAVVLCRYVKLMKEVLGNHDQAFAEQNRRRLETFKAHLTSEIEALGDPSLDKEILMLDSQIPNLAAQATTHIPPAHPVQPLRGRIGLWR